jgi:zinc/manganese transport system permease protein
VGAVAALYAVVGALHWLCRRPLLEISHDADGARARGRRVVAWDIMFYVTFAVVVTSSVRLAGVLLVFAYLVIPAALAVLVVASVPARLAVGWSVGVLASTGGLAAAYRWDLPTGASVVTVLGAVLAAATVARGAGTLAGAARRGGWRALRGAGGVACAAIALSGLLLLLFPAMDHPWLDLLEAGVPGVRRVFLTPAERQADAESRRALTGAEAELARLRALQDDVRWGRRELPPETQERLRQFLAGRGEIAAGDRLVLATHRARARSRQRWVLGAPSSWPGRRGPSRSSAAAPPARRAAPSAPTDGSRTASTRRPARSGPALAPPRGSASGTPATAARRSRAPAVASARRRSCAGAARRGCRARRSAGARAG